MCMDQVSGAACCLLRRYLCHQRQRLICCSPRFSSKSHPSNLKLIISARDISQVNLRPVMQPALIGQEIGFGVGAKVLSGFSGWQRRRVLSSAGTQRGCRATATSLSTSSGWARALGPPLPGHDPKLQVPSGPIASQTSHGATVLDLNCL